MKPTVFLLAAIIVFTTSTTIYLPIVIGPPKATLTPTITTPTATEGPCNCYGPDLDCGDFATHAAAQACFDWCWSLGLGDVFNLDAGNDGIACESLPRIFR